jgi:hypothetical protein
MIMTRRFGALRAMPVFPAVTEHDERLDYFGDVRPHGEEPQETGKDEGKDEGESAA